MVECTTMTGFSIDELRGAEIVPNQGGPNAWLVRFGEKDYRTVPKTPKHRLLLQSDALQRAEGGDTRQIEVDSSTHHVTLTANIEEDSYQITVDGRQIDVPESYEKVAIEAYIEEDWKTLYELHQEMLDSRVRVGLMDRFMPRFSDAREENRLRKSDDGWVVDESFVVQWDGKNYLTEEVETHIVEEGDATRVDGTLEARQLEFDAPNSKTVTDPNGNSVELSSKETTFLATVECLLYPQKYLSEEDAEYVEKVVDSDPISSLAQTAEVTGFTDETDGLWHSHSLKKHRLQDIGVTDEVTDLLDHQANGHSALHELWARRHEFQEMDDVRVFEDVANDDFSKWERINEIRKKAPIPNDIQNKIQEEYGGV